MLRLNAGVQLSHGGVINVGVSVGSDEVTVKLSQTQGDSRNVLISQM